MKEKINKYLNQQKTINFSNLLFLYIDKSGLKDSWIYKKAGIDRKLFSKIRCNNYILSKKYIIRLCLVLKLSLEETNLLLNSAGYSLSSSIDFDLVIKYFIENKIYDLYIINEMLETFLKTVL